MTRRRFSKRRTKTGQWRCYKNSCNYLQKGQGPHIQSTVMECTVCGWETIAHGGKLKPPA